MEPGKLAMMWARGRIAFGIGALILPGPAVRLMAARRKSGGMASFLMRMVGGRDVALGLGTVIALDQGKPVRGWVEGAALADAVDCLASLLAREELSPRALQATAGIAAASALFGGLLSRQVDPPPAAQPGQPEATVTGH